MLFKHDCALRLTVMDRAFYQLQVAGRVRGHDRGVIPGAGENVPSHKDGNWAGALSSPSVLRACFKHHTHLCWPPSYPFVSLANRTLIWFGQQCAQTQKIDQDWSNPVLSPYSLWSRTRLPEGLGLSWPVRCDRKSAGETVSPVKGGLEKSHFAITSLALGIVMRCL